MRRPSRAARVPRILLAREHLGRIQGEASAHAPEEVCGVLVGRREGDDIVVERIEAARNAHGTPRVAYLVEPADLLRVLLLAEDEWGMEVVGFYHSHPDGPAGMSVLDAALASWPDAAYLLVWLRPTAGVGCWTWRDASGRFEPRDVVVRATPP